VAFIDFMVERDVVLLGGNFGGSVAGAQAAYLLHTSTPQEADSWAHQDPLVMQQYFVPEVVEWRLVGVAIGAIDPVVRLPK
jgi:hypothetical protein